MPSGALQVKRGLAAGIPTGAAGEPLWTTDTQRLYIGTGSGNVLIGGAGTGVNVLTTKGDILTYDTAPVRLPVGANGTVLMADSTQDAGVKWGSASGSPLAEIGDIWVYGTSGDMRMPAGSNERVLVTDDTSPYGLEWRGTSTEGHVLRYASGAVAWGYVDATQLSGAVPVGNGGTGLTTVANNDLLIGDSGNVITTLAEPSVAAILHWDSGTINWTALSSIASTVADLVSPLTTKGDLFGYTTADARVPVGDNGTVLMADSTQAAGLTYTSELHSRGWMGV